MTAAALPALARKAGMERLALRIAEMAPTLMVFGPAAAFLYLLTSSLSGLRWAPGA